MIFTLFFILVVGLSFLLFAYVKKEIQSTFWLMAILPFLYFLIEIMINNVYVFVSNWFLTLYVFLVFLMMIFGSLADSETISENMKIKYMKVGFLVFFFFHYIFLSEVLVLVGNICYSGPEDVYTFRIKEYRMVKGKNKDSEYWDIEAVDKNANPKAIPEEEIPFVDRFSLNLTKMFLYPVFSVYVADSKEKHCTSISYTTQLNKCDLIGVKMRRGYFGEVLAKDDLCDIYKVKFDSVCSYVPLISK